MNPCKFVRLSSCPSIYTHPHNTTQPDPLLLLPLACLSSTYLNLELGFAKLHESQKILRFLKDNLQLLLILGAPVSSTLPSGVFVYWLTSSLFGHAQHFALKSPAVRQALGFPPIPIPPPAAPAPASAPAPAEAAAAQSGAAGVGGGSGMMVDPQLMAKAMETLEEYEARRQPRLGAGKEESRQPAPQPPEGLSMFPTKKKE